MTDNLINALIKAQQEIDHVVQDGNNPFFKSDYATLKEVIDSVKKPLNDNGILLQQESHDCDNGACVETIFYGHGGKISTGRVTIPASKQDPQAYGSALSYAKRYSLLMACGVATKKEDDDAEQAMQRNKPAPAVSKTKPKDSLVIRNKEGIAITAFPDTDSYLDGLRKVLADPESQECIETFKANSTIIEDAYNKLHEMDKNKPNFEKLIDLYAPKS